MADWLVPDWPAPPCVRALCTTRAGGVSAAPYDSLNLGDHVGDDPVSVEENRARLATHIGVRPVFLQQVHGTQVLQLTPHTPHASTADACVTTQPQVACTIMVADCLPALFTDTSGAVVGAAHAGWRGLCNGVIEQSLERFSALASEKPAQAAIKSIANEVLVWLGPCIGPTAFEVGPEVREAFVAKDPQAEACFTPLVSGKYLADLPALARQRLAAWGVSRIYGNDSSPSWCTVTNAATYFSHRRDRVSGRFAACIWRI